jgi:hypothetical protein
MCLMLFACGVFGWILGSIGRVVTKSGELAEKFRTQITDVNNFLRHKKIPREMRMKVRRYLEFFFVL